MKKYSKVKKATFKRLFFSVLYVVIVAEVELLFMNGKGGIVLKGDDCWKKLSSNASVFKFSSRYTIV